MKTKYIVRIKGTTYYYPTFDEAVKMARFVGIAVSEIKEAHVY